MSSTGACKVCTKTLAVPTARSYTDIQAFDNARQLNGDVNNQSYYTYNNPTYNTHNTNNSNSSFNNGTAIVVGLASAGLTTGGTAGLAYGYAHQTTITHTVTPTATAHPTSQTGSPSTQQPPAVEPTPVPADDDQPSACPAKPPRPLKNHKGDKTELEATYDFHNNESNLDSSSSTTFNQSNNSGIVVNVQFPESTTAEAAAGAVMSGSFVAGEYQFATPRPTNCTTFITITEKSHWNSRTPTVPAAVKTASTETSTSMTTFTTLTSHQTSTTKTSKRKRNSDEPADETPPSKPKRPRSFRNSSSQPERHHSGRSAMIGGAVNAAVVGMQALSRSSITTLAAQNPVPQLILLGAQSSEGTSGSGEGLFINEGCRFDASGGTTAGVESTRPLPMRKWLEAKWAEEAKRADASRVMEVD
ncbi:hypothetical protein BJ508DRAFT_364310 [Ascobolus immersus RN42]|uniref:Uncharacterized protein n=1 Tax=Ascobolus immersus RN42 TaxID=1160509 RepID=A0A3N4HV26_ASCIM|nr:hypothetical protein BJ508DRAFT_364310 [Ascobolus immersus RN42]